MRIQIGQTMEHLYMHGYKWTWCAVFKCPGRPGWCEISMLWKQYWLIHVRCSLYQDYPHQSPAAIPPVTRRICHASLHTRSHHRWAWIKAIRTQICQSRLLKQEETRKNTPEPDHIHAPEWRHTVHTNSGLSISSQHSLATSDQRLQRSCRILLHQRHSGYPPLQWREEKTRRW